MPKLIINTTAAQAQRISIAYGRLLNLRTPDKSAERNANAAEIKAAIIDQIRQTVIGYEQGVAAEAAIEAVSEIDPS